MAEDSNVFSLQSRRTQANLKARRGMLSAEDRIHELEDDMDRVIALVIQQQKQIEEMEDRQWKLLRLIGKRLGINTGR